MERDFRILSVPPDSELALLIKQAADAGASLVVDTGDALYRLSISPAPKEQEDIAAQPSKTASPMLTPQEFYQEMKSRADVREILTRLAKG